MTTAMASAPQPAYSTIEPIVAPPESELEHTEQLLSGRPPPSDEVEVTSDQESFWHPRPVVQETVKKLESNVAAAVTTHSATIWEYNAGRDINITNVQSWTELADELGKMQSELKQASEKQVLTDEVTKEIRDKLAEIAAGMRQVAPNQAGIQKQLQTTRTYVDQTRIAMTEAVYAPQKSSETRDLLLAGLAALAAITFDLGITVGIVALLPKVIRFGQGFNLGRTDTRPALAYCSNCGAPQ